jgi:hypothetical protein
VIRELGTGDWDIRRLGTKNPQYPNTLISSSQSPDNLMSNKHVHTKKAFTLIEVMVTFAIFIIISGIVLTVIVAGFRAFNQGQKMAEIEQRKRFVFFRLGKEFSSLTRIVYPGSYFKGDEKSFFLSLTKRIT